MTNNGATMVLSTTLASTLVFRCRVYSGVLHLLPHAAIHKQLSVKVETL